MGCSIDGIPKYLYFSTNKKVYKPKNFRFYHLLFITGFKERHNPIEFPYTLTAISVCWSKLIFSGHVLSVVKALASNPDSRGDHVFFGRVKRIKKFNVEGVCDSIECKGRHTLTTEIIHTPIECNYSHSEILIKHVYLAGNKTNVEIVSKEQFDKKKCLLRKNAHKDFFKPLLLQYRAKMATALNADIDELNIPWHLRILPKNFIVSLSLWRVMTYKSR